MTDGPHGDYTLFQSPPRRDFARHTPQTLSQLGFAPAAMLSIRWANPAQNGTLCLGKIPLTKASGAAPPLRPDVLAKARDLPLPQPSSDVQAVPPQVDGGAHTGSRDADATKKRKFPKVCTHSL